MRTKQIFAALAMLSLAVTASVAQARSHDAAWSARTNYQDYDPPWTFACIKDHGDQPLQRLELMDRRSCIHDDHLLAANKWSRGKE
jgi:hypothetical protein